MTIADKYFDQRPVGTLTFETGVGYTRIEPKPFDAFKQGDRVRCTQTWQSQVDPWEKQSEGEEFTIRCILPSHGYIMLEEQEWGWINADRFEKIV